MQRPGSWKPRCRAAHVRALANHPAAAALTDENGPPLNGRADVALGHIASGDQLANQLANQLA
jgi:hypothetical protein